MRIRLFLVAMCSLLSAFQTPLRAATIELLYHDPSGATVIYLSGEVVAGDAEKFHDVIEGVSRGIVYLESPGGLLAEGLNIGATIRLRSLSTSVGAGKECFSACALIWTAGFNRYMSRESIIGYHAAYTVSDGVAQESGVANAEVGAYLTHLGLSIDAIRFATVAGPADAMLLSPELARSVGIDVVLQDEGGALQDQRGTSGRDYAMNFVNLTYWQETCSPVFGELPSNVRELQQAAFDQGNFLLGPDAWIDTQLQVLDSLVAFSGDNGELLACLKVEDELRNNFVSTGFLGPSFDCNKSATPTEFAICSDPGVWASDFIMNGIYLNFRAADDSEMRVEYFKGQRAWLVVRDSCGGDQNCIRESYLSRLRVLSRLLGLME